MRRETISFGKLFRFFPFGFFFLRFFETDFLRGKILIDKPAVMVVDFDFDRHFQHIDRNDRPFSVGRSHLRAELGNFFIRFRIVIALVA